MNREYWRRKSMAQLKLKNLSELEPKLKELGESKRNSFIKLYSEKISDYIKSLMITLFCFAFFTIILYFVLGRMVMFGYILIISYLILFALIFEMNEKFNQDLENNIKSLSKK